MSNVVVVLIQDSYGATAQTRTEIALSETVAKLNGDVEGPASSTNSNIALFDGVTGKLLKDSGKAISTDGTFASNSDNKVPTEKAVKTYVDAAVVGLLDLKGSTDCSANPNYPVGTKGDAYYVSVAGKIGGASGKTVGVGDVYIASADNAGGTEASVGTSWFVLEANGAFQPLDATLTALAGLPTGANKIPYSTGSDTFGQLDFSTDGTLAGNSDTTIPSQKAIKTYVDNNSSSGPANMAAAFEVKDDFIGGYNFPKWFENGSGVTVTITGGESGHPGILTIDTGSGWTDWGSVRTYPSGGYDTLDLGDAELTFEVVVKTPANLGDVTNNYDIFLGVSDARSALPNNGFIIRYNYNENSGKWQFLYRKGGATKVTINHSGTAVATSTWYKLKFTITKNGSDHDCEFFVDGSSAGTGTATNSGSNTIATGTRGEVHHSIVKAGFTGSRVLYVDSTQTTQTLTR